MPPQRLHLCTLPTGTPGQLHTCPGCRAGFRYRSVASRELGRVINLWVKEAR